MKYSCSTETVQQNGRFTLFSSKFHSNIYSVLFDTDTSYNVLKNNITVYYRLHKVHSSIEIRYHNANFYQRRFHICLSIPMFIGTPYTPTVGLLVNVKK